jgi:integrase/recombinase XerC
MAAARRPGNHLGTAPAGEDGFLPGAIVLRHLRDLQLRGQTPDTVYCRRRALARLAAALPVPVLDATAADLADWRAGLSVGPGTVVGYVSHAREFYAWAITAGLITENPAADLPVPPLPRRLPRPIGEQDLFAAIAGAPDRIRPWLVLAGWAGLRAKEIAGLRRENVLDRVSPPLLIVAHDATKGRTERAVPLCAFALRELLAAGLPASGWVFRRRDDQPGPNRPWIVSQLCNEYLHGLGITATLHQLRHRFGTETYRGRRDLRLVQELLGHASPSTTAGYAAVDQADAADVVEHLAVPSVPPRLRALP